MDAVAESMPHSVAAGVTAAMTVEIENTPATSIDVRVPSAKIAGVPGLVEVKRSVTGEKKTAPAAERVRLNGVGTSAGTVGELIEVTVGTTKVTAAAPAGWFAHELPRGAVHRMDAFALGVETVGVAASKRQMDAIGVENVNDVPPAPTVPGTSICCCVPFPKSSTFPNPPMIGVV